MIIKRDFMKKLKKNRILVLVISVIILSGVYYYGVQKAIDAYNFENDIILTEDDVSAPVSMGNAEGGAGASGQIPEDEVALEVEGMGEGDEEEGNVEEGDVEEVLENGESLDSEELQEKIYVYITGEVNVPGVVILNKGSRIVDAINSAGGTTVKANVTKVNLVYVLEDGMKVNIPNSNDLKNNPDFEYITMNSGDGADDAGVIGGSGNNYSESNSGFSSNSANNYSIVNINTATQTELESLPGIGPSLALKIINYRKENGRFSSIEEIKNVSGIGDSKFESLKSYIKV